MKNNDISHFASSGDLKLSVENLINHLTRSIEWDEEENTSIDPN
jgi:hypothetical protein